jgi:hypothetical protein
MSGSLSKDERRRLKIQRRKEEKRRMQGELSKKDSNANRAIFAIAGIVIAGAAGFFLLQPAPETGDFETSGLSFPLGNIHWHAAPTVTICGENVPIPTPRIGGHLGSSLLHTHDDAQIHVEGTVSNPSQITLGKFMENIGMKFSQNELLDKKNGNVCFGSGEGKVKLIVNGLENDQFENYVIRDGDQLEMKFE